MECEAPHAVAPNILLLSAGGIPPPTPSPHWDMGEGGGVLSLTQLLATRMALPARITYMLTC
jgi:hypothetical protein